MDQQRPERDRRPYKAPEVSTYSSKDIISGLGPALATYPLGDTGTPNP